MYLISAVKKPALSVTKLSPVENRSYHSTDHEERNDAGGHSHHHVTASACLAVRHVVLYTGETTNDEKNIKMKK